VNIWNFVRDGAKHGAIGVLNTAWDDDGCNFNAPNWHGYAWGAECAWNASATTPELFNRRLGAALFGEKGDHFGQAIELLAQAQHIPTIKDCRNKRFWSIELTPPQEVPRKDAQKILDVVQPAIEHLQTCQKEATANAYLLDYFLFGARRIELIGQRMLDRFDAISAYEAARKLPPQETDAHLLQAEQTIRKLQVTHELLGRQFEDLWARENKPYALDWTTQKFQDIADTYKSIADKIAAAHQSAKAGQPLPTLIEVGLVRPETTK